ncbi:penicillin-binding protein activator [Roseovarius nanhaiticus]|uniref:Amino acid/amide ABC transporter substrate-binding protein, HAAT family n=1 Tax=Roseovarius nanhaiticus TaxID=573024 RepID=A0A1N7EXX8_9RHOB|nr:penicillin-binding protein activator [Roseovarius nanhaiticus]SEK64865.1 amino acid/amide ABC transporter substrate-binding protein, HAAT family [Roseovarius nanhaiticus]SIR92765.1 amino acid/amide ABC transporter substrate-binding protein, HAAT family [Roseovarius nanhaiticus]
MFAVLPFARKVLTRLIALVSLLWVAACEPVGLAGVGGGGGQSIDPNAPVAVALLVPHGSTAPGEAALARDLEAAARLAVADLAGVRIDLRVYGTAGRAAQAQQAALNAVADGAKIIIGPLHAESANAVALAVAPKNVNVLAFSNNATIAGGNLFVLGQTFDNTADRLTRFAVRQGKTRIVTVSSNNLAGQLGQQAIAKAAANAGAQIVGNVGYDFSQDGVVSAVPQITQTVNSTSAQAVFLTSNSAGALPLLAQMLPENGLSPAATQYIGLARWDTPAQTLELPGLQGGWFALPDQAKARAFQSRFAQTTGNQPHPIAGLAYDGIAAIGALIKAGKRDALSRSGLTQSAGFQGVDGVFRLRSDGTNQRGLAVATIRDSKVVILDPAPRGFGGAGF